MALKLTRHVSARPHEESAGSDLASRERAAAVAKLVRRAARGQVITAATATALATAAAVAAAATAGAAAFTNWDSTSP